MEYLGQDSDIGTELHGLHQNKVYSIEPLWYQSRESGLTWERDEWTEWVQWTVQSAEWGITGHGEREDQGNRGNQFIIERIGRIEGKCHRTGLSERRKNRSVGQLDRKVRRFL